MTEKGIIVCRPDPECILNGLEYLLDERNEIRHFASEEEAGNFLRGHGIDIRDGEESIILKYHVFCGQCHREFFFDTDELHGDTGEEYYFCPACEREIEEKMSVNNN